MMKQHSQAGFTLIELMITLVIAAIVLTQGVPSFMATVQNNRLITYTNDLVSDINLARSEAVKRGSRVVLCRTADPSAAAPACGGTANTWSTGWLVFADADADGSFNAGDTLVRVGMSVNTSTTIISNAVANSNLQYNGDGTTNAAGGTGVFTLCDSRGAGNGRQIQVNAMGRPQLVKGSDANVTLNCTAPAAV
ncbi:MAG: GspH/FimT family pseudopilin [Gammaproteobacteria bacterium]|nr:GspH/FimT family pseudopilin [Gammaproteobacteria bacterium]